MPEEKEAQARPEGKQASQVHFDDLFAKGWAETVEAPVAPQAAPAKKADEDECPDCPPVGAESKDRKPIEVLKHKGKEVPVYSKKQLIDMAQQGFDYTQKRQADSEDRKKWESEFETRNKQLMEQAKRLDALLATAQSRTAAAPGTDQSKPSQPEVTTTGVKSEEAILKEYGVDPEYATDAEKSMAIRQYKHDQELQEVKKVAQMMLLDAVFRRVATTIEEAQKEYPIEDVKLEDGKSATQEQVINIFRDKLSKPENQHRPIQEIARETIKEVHEFQKAAKGAPAPAGKSPEECTDEELKVLYPKLYARLKSGNGESELPPTMDRASRAPSREPVSKVRPDSRHKFRSLEEAIEMGMKDPETLKAITGG